MSKWIAVIAIGCMARASLAGGLIHGALAPRFEENAGQAPGNVRFVLRAPGYAAAFDREGTVLLATSPGAADSGIVQMRLLGGAERPTVAGEGSPVASTMLYSGAFSSPGLRLGNYAAIRYRGVYPGIDWVWHFRESALEFQFELCPGANPAAIRMAFAGASGVRLDQDGNLDVEGGAGLHYRRPEAWQESHGGRVAVPVAFRIDSGVVSFEVGPHDPELALTIDPVVRYSRYLGGAGYDAAYAVATDTAGKVYVTGETSSVDFSSSNGVRYNRDAFVSKLSADGGQVVYTVILSSSGNDAGKAIAVDGGGNVWVAGVAGGSGFPVTSDALSTRSSGAEDAFVARLDSNGLLKYATYLGGSGTDVATALGIDASGSVYVAGYTSSVNFPTTPGAPQTTFQGGTDAFLVKLGTGGTFLSYATLLGGPGNDSANALSVDAAGNACVAGRTDSANLPVRNAVQAAYGGNGDALLACLNPTGTAWSTLTYLGGSGPDEALGIARDAAGNTYLAGDTYSSNFPTTSTAYRKSSAGGYDAFAVKLNPAGTAIVFATLLGGSANDSATAISVDSSGGVWIAGYTASVDFPVAGAPTFGGYFDGFLAEIGPDGSSLLWAGYFGGSGDDRCLGMALADTRDPIVVGVTGSVNFPVTTGGAPAPYNAFVTRVSGNVPPTAVSVSGSSSSGSATFIATLSDGDGYADIQNVYFLIDQALTEVNTCYVTYNRGTNGLYLINDNGTAWLSPVVPGTSATVSNSQCTLDAAGSSVTGAGTTLTLQFRLNFQPSFSGAKNLYLIAYDASTATSGWQNFGTFTIGNGLPQIASVTQGTASGGAPTYAVTVQDGNGYSSIRTVYFLVNSTLSGLNACYLAYERATNGLYLLNDASSAWLTPLTPGTSATVSNSQCTLLAADSSISGAGNAVTVQFSVRYRSGFTGAKSLYVVAFDYSNVNTGWQTMGATTIGPNVSPQMVSVVQGTAAGGAPTFAVTVQDGNGYSDIQTVDFLIDGQLSGVNACYLVYKRGTNLIYLLNDDSSASLTPVTPDTSAWVSNSQCTLLAADSSITGNGNAMTVQFGVRYKSGFTGLKSIYVSARDFGDADTGWQTTGTTTIGPNVVPQAVSVVPTTLGTDSAALTVTTQDGNGYSDILAVYLLIDRTLSGLNACYLAYHRDTNELYLLNDAGTIWFPAGAPSASGKVSNSQCTLNTASSSVTGTGATLSVVFSLQFQPGFAGSKSFYVVAFDFSNSTGGWQTEGSWIVP